MRVDPSLSLGRVETMDAIVRAARAKEAFVGVLLLLAATVSLFLGTIGTYGNVAQLVKRRTPEIGIRMTLGAGRSEVVRMVVTGSLRGVLVGIGVGAIGAIASTRALRSMLFGVEPTDPTVFVAVVALLVTSAIGAALMAAARAARIDPTVALRSE
jgi:ABC-type antimicrobial peptide transport system permease subunit